VSSEVTECCQSSRAVFRDQMLSERTELFRSSLSPVRARRLVPELTELCRAHGVLVDGAMAELTECCLSYGVMSELMECCPSSRSGAGVCLCCMVACVVKCFVAEDTAASESAESGPSSRRCVRAHGVMAELTNVVRAHEVSSELTECYSGRSPRGVYRRQKLACWLASWLAA
jgi:hypothetical protein